MLSHLLHPCKSYLLPTPSSMRFVFRDGNADSLTGGSPFEPKSAKRSRTRSRSCGSSACTLFTPKLNSFLEQQTDAYSRTSGFSALGLASSLLMERLKLSTGTNDEYGIQDEKVKQEGFEA